jgi:tRNA-specific 2-thiouridylase
MTRQPRKKQKVFVAMSGGVDSSVAAYWLKQQGYEVIGIHLRCWSANGCHQQEATDARRVAEFLSLPFYVLDLETEYKQKVVDYMIDGYRRGITPNPDVMCNREIKFGLFLKQALEMGADYVATGHYVRLSPGRPAKGKERRSSYRAAPLALFEAKDKNKDQSYFLWTLTQNQLKHLLFPLGDYLKSEVRSIAKTVGLPTAEKKDSQGICFVGKVTLSQFLSQYLGSEPGQIITTDGKVVGVHPGIQFYTIGQRHGLGVALNVPHYVAAKDRETNTLVVAPLDDPLLYRREIMLSEMNFINPEFPSRVSEKGKEVFVRIRYRQPLRRAILTLTGQGARLIFEEPQPFIAPGQSAVFYSETGELQGGGIIL